MPLTAEQALVVTRRLHADVLSRRGDAQNREDYYKGKQSLKYASEKWREYHGQRYAGFADNWCAPVANTPNERLRIEGFRLDDAPEQSGDEKLLWKDWQLNDMEAQSSQGFLHGIITDRSFVKVWGTRDNEPIVTWERSDQMTIEYDPANPRDARYDLKTYVDGDTEFATLTTKDQVWKWRRPVLPMLGGKDGPASGSFFLPAGVNIGSDTYGWAPYQPDDDDTWPITNPMGVVSAVEMPNRPLLGRGPISDIKGTMAMQDAINLLWAYLFTQADFAGMPARVVMGQEPPKIPILDETGQKVGEREVPLKKLSEDRILWLTGEKARVDQWDAAKLDMFTTVIEIAVTHIAAQTSTPATRLVLGQGMVNVSADGMRAAETGQVMKVREMHLFLTPPARGIFQRFALVRGKTALSDACKLGTVGWRDPENHSEAQRVDALQKLDAIGFPFAWIAERYGLSPADVARVLDMKKKEMEDDPMAAMVANMPAAPAGGVPEAPVRPPAE
ncbi:MAG: phage portal protein [Actinoplanes sp.]